MDLDGLSLICGGLGSIEEDETTRNHIGYTKGEYCLDNLMDLLRFLRRDDPETRDVFKQVCRWNIVGKDLIPMIEYQHDADPNLVLSAVKVLVFLTMPLEASSKDANQQLEYLWGLKSAVTYSKTVAVIVSLLESPGAFSEDDWKLVQLMLTLFRNLLAVNDISAQQKAEGSVTHYLSLRDDFLELLFKENVMDLIIVLTQHIGDHRSYLRQDNLLLLETYHYIFMGQDSEVIAKTCLTASKSGSVALRKGMPVPVLCDSNLKSGKVQHGPVKKVVPVPQHVKLPTAKKNILELLYDFMNQFLSGGYNVLMQSILEDIEKEYHAIQDPDVLVFFQLAQCATSFQFHKCSMIKPNVESDGSPTNTDGDNKSFNGNMCGPIAASMNESMFLLVIEKWRYAFEGLKELKNYKFLSVAGSLMKIMFWYNLLRIMQYVGFSLIVFHYWPKIVDTAYIQRRVDNIQMLDLVLKQMPENDAESDAAYAILYKLLYDQTDQGLTQFILNLVKSFSTVKQTKSDLADLVEMLYLVIRLMEKLQAHGTLRNLLGKVSRKARKRRKKNKADDMTNGENGPLTDLVTIDKEANVSGLAPDTGVQVQEENAASTSPGNERSSFPSVGDETGTPGVQSSDHRNAGRELPELDNRELNHVNIDIGNLLGDDGSSDDEQLPLVDEVDFKINTLLVSLASNSIVTNSCWLLKFYKSNSSSTNHHIISILERICYDMNLTPMLYQLSYLCIFYEILEEQKSYPCKEHEVIVTFLTTLVRRMLRKMKSQPLLFVEVLFSKSRRDCNFIDVETMSHEVGSMKAELRSWGHGSDDPDLGSSHLKNGTRRSMADALGDDEYGVVVPNEHEFEEDEDPEESHMEHVLHDRKDRACKSKADGESRMGGPGNTNKSGTLSVEDDHVGIAKRKRRLVLDNEIEEKVRGLFEKYKDNRHCSRLIAEELHLDQSISPAQVSNLCKKLGLKVPPRKKMNNIDELPLNVNHKDSGGDAGKDVGLPHSDTLAETSSLRQSLHTRKRVRAFDDAQEQKIRNLFEQFKDNKKCSHMIANALDPDGKVTSAQISRKLKQLGLRTAQARKRQTQTFLRDEELDDVEMNADSEDDNLPLSLLTERNKDKRNAIFPSEEVSDPSTDVEEEADDSDDDVLISVIKKARQTQSMTEEKPPSSSIRDPESVHESKNGVAQGSIERDSELQDSQSDATESNDKGTKADGSPSESTKHEATSFNIGEGKGLPVEDINQRQHQDVYDDFSDSEDDITPTLLESETFESRRKRRIVELEDDE
ncbi:timeless-like protein [Drosera capensis]